MTTNDTVAKALRRHANKKAFLDQLYGLSMNQSMLGYAGNAMSTQILRVPGGWIYQDSWVESGEQETSCAVSTTFVPWIDRMDA